MTAYVFLIMFWIAAYYYLLYRSRDITGEVRENRNKIFIILAGTALFVIMGLRHKGVGTDTMQYLRVYHGSSYYDWETIFRTENLLDAEIGFKLWNSLLSFLHLPDQLYLMVYAMFVVYCTSRFVMKYCKNPFWGFYLNTTIGLFTMSMSGMRQTLACCICWLALDFILEKKPIKFFLMVLLAASFHQSAIFFAVFYFARYIKVNKTTGWLISGFCMLCIFLRPVLIPLLNLFMPEKYDRYQMVSDQYSVNPMLVAMGLLIPMFCLFFWERKKIKDEKEEQRYSLWFAGSFCYAIIAVLSLSSMMIGRMWMYFYLFNVVLLGNIISEIEDFNTRTLVAVCAILFPGYLFFKSQSLGIAPYYFFWQTYGM